MRDSLEDEEDALMLGEHPSKEQTTTLLGEASSKKVRRNSTSRAVYVLLLTCTIPITIFSTFALGRHFGSHDFDRRCIEHVSMYCRFLTLSSVCGIHISYTNSARPTGNEPTMDSCAVQWDTRASDRVDWGSAPRGRRGVGKMGKWYAYPTAANPYI